METTLNADSRAVAEEFGRLASDLAAKYGYPPRPGQDVVAAAFTGIGQALAGGGWLDAAAVRGEPDELALLVSMAEAAGTVRPSLAYPLAEAWTARRLLSRLEADGAFRADGGTGPDGAFGPDQVVLADVTAPHREPAEPAGAIAWPHGPRADQLLFLEHEPGGGFAVRSVPGRDVVWTALDQADVTRPIFRMDLAEGVTPQTIGHLSDEQGRVVAAESLLLEAADMLGCADGLLRATLSHVTVREQFGRPLAAFQALRHRLADAFTRVETLRSHVYYAAWVADYRPAQVTEWAQMAKGLAGGSCWDVANEAIQLHGAMGFTWEMGLQHQVGRVIARTLSYPSAQECLERVGAAMARRGHLIQLVE